MKACRFVAVLASAIAVATVISSPAQSWAQAKPAKKPVLTIGRAMLLADYGGGKVYRIAESGKVVWQMPAPQAQDVWMLPDGNVLYTYINGVRIASPDEKVVWEYKTAKGNEVHACQPLADGKIMIAESGAMRIIEVTRDKKIVKEVKLTTACKQTHGQMRNVRKLANGHYLVGQYHEGLLREYDSAGKIVREIKQKQMFGGIELPNGNIIASCADAHRIIEVDPAGKAVWQITENELPGNPLRFVAGMRLAPNGNLIVANWGGHGHTGQQPQMFEVTHDAKKKVVGVIWDDTQFKTLSGMYVLDEKFGAKPTAANLSAVAAGKQPVLTIGRDLLLGDNGKGKVFRMDKTGKIVWEIPAPGVQDVWMLPDGNVLFTCVKAVRIANPEKRIVWEYKTAKGNEIHSCQPLPDGKVLIAENGPLRLIEVDRDGKITKEVKVSTTTRRVHMQMRHVRKLANGNYLVSMVGEGVLREYDAIGKVVREFPQMDVFEGTRLANGNTLIAGGDGHIVKEVDPAGKVVWQIGENDLPGIPLRFVAGIGVLPNGNLLVCNWGGHGRVGQQPQVVEVTHDAKKKVVGEIWDNAHLRTVSCVYVIDGK